MSNPDITNLFRRSLPMGDNDHRTGILTAGQVAAKGQLLGFVSADGKLKNTASASTDGSEYGRAIAAHDVDASGGEESITYIIKGKVDDALIVFDGSDDLDTVVAGQPLSYREMLRDAGIYANTYTGDQVQDNQ